MNFSDTGVLQWDRCASARQMYFSETCVLQRDRCTSV